MRNALTRITRSLAAALLLCAAPPLAQSAAQPAPAVRNVAPDVTPSFDLAGIAHVAFRVSDLPAALAFYQKLGFVRAFELTTKDGQPSEEFIKLNDRQFVELYPASLAPTEPLGLMHICYEAANLAAVQAAYSGAGLNPPIVRKAGAGNLLLVLRGPGNVVIEYTQYMPGSMHTRDIGQHLGADRVAMQLTGVTEPVQDPAAFQQLFLSKLHFTADGQTAPMQLRLPGAASAFVSFASIVTTPRATIVLSGGDLRSATATLRQAGIYFVSAHGTVTLDDPDGNHLILQP